VYSVQADRKAEFGKVIHSSVHTKSWLHPTSKLMSMVCVRPNG